MSSCFRKKDMFPLPFNLLLVWNLLSGQSSYCTKHYTIFLQNVEIFRNIFFQRIVFGSRKRKNISKFFWEDFYLSKLMNQLIEMCGSCPWIACITIYCWFKVWTCHKLGGRPIVQWATAFLMDISRLAAEIVHTTSSVGGEEERGFVVAQATLRSPSPLSYENMSP